MIMFLAGFLAYAAMQSEGAQLQSVPPGRWTIDYGRVSCTLARRIAGENSAILALNAPLGTEPGEFVLLDGGGGLDPRLAGPLEIGFGSGAPVVVQATTEQRNGRAVVKLTPVPDDFLARIAAAGRIAVTRNGEELFAFAAPDARAGIDALARCNEDLLRGWGIDVPARRALSRIARLRRTDWAGSVMPRASTFLVFVAQVSERGRATGCRVVVSSRNPRMDQAVCAEMRSAARYEPALDGEGRPVASQYVTRIRWVMTEP
jgi:hypothetical protein